jgi:hypothetical protein
MGVKKALPNVSTPNSRAGYLLTGFTLIAAAFAVVGIKTDELANVWRNECFLSHAAIALVFIAVALGATAGWVLKAGTTGERVCLIVGNALLGLGLIATAWAGLELASARSEPTITANPVAHEGQTTLELTVENTKLRADEDLSVFVEPLFEVEDENGKLDYRVGRALYSASLGPDDDGNVKRTVSVDVPTGKFEDVGVRASVDPDIGCYDANNTTGCVVVRVPQRTEEPQLTFRWRKPGRAGAALRVHVTALDIAGTSLRFLAQGVKPRKKLLALANLGPDLHGDVSHAFVLPVKGTRLLCIAASTTERRLTCPPRNPDSVSWARLRVPRQE